ncbi:Uncharacterized protein GBIM_19867 [Gryllus bimaculatus]|nr:Uncharacterized protein GBIM_19867 [Gryllus bimaculatus]
MENLKNLFKLYTLNFFNIFLFHWLLFCKVEIRAVAAQDIWCPLCERFFVNKFNLKVHMRDVHSSAQSPLLCPLCSRQVKNRSSLRVHLYQQHRKKSNY